MNKIYIALVATFLSLFLVSCDKDSPAEEITEEDRNKEFFKFEFKGTTYNLSATLANRGPLGGYLFMGIVGNNNGLVTVVINTETSSATTQIPFGSLEEAGKSFVQFNIPQSDIYSTTGSDCRGRPQYSQGHAKLTAIGNVGGYMEGNFSGTAYFQENACPDKGTVRLESFTGSFKLLRRFE